MFTGIVESIGQINQLEKDGSNLEITVTSDITSQLKIDQSVAHNGVCLTVVEINHQEYRVTAIEETLQKTNLSSLKVGKPINLELAMKNNMRLDGHMVQGHVDQVARCIRIDDKNGSWDFTFEFVNLPKFLLVNKGSVCIDGVSLTVVEANENKFIVSIIPYTFEHTIFNSYSIGTQVNIEFDIIGKYVQKHIEHYKKQIE